MMQKTNLRDKRGITLIALVITIIVLLILAGVTINLTLGENGIFTTAQKAAKNYTESQNKEMAGISGFTNAVDKTIHSIEQGVYYVNDIEGNEIPVPLGFSPIKAKDQGTKNTGFVIKNDTDGNEFVWVPCTLEESINGIMYDRYDFQTQYGSYSSYTEILPTDEQRSIINYGGYYIGRYEAGIVGGTKGDTKIDGTYYTGDNMKLVVKSGQQVWNNIDKGRALKEATNLYNKEEDNVTSKLCSSYAWDTALKFIESTESTYPTNSVGGYYEQASPTTTGNNTIHPCNIYDMGGNVWEWTTETYGSNTSSVFRGGAYTTKVLENPASYRRWHSESTLNDSIGFRVTLFL